jgi:hypothetical protein
MLAAKFFDDQYYNNAYYAQIGGVSTEEINSLEVEFLFMINFSLHVSREIYDQYHRELTKHMMSGCSCQGLVQPHSTPAVQSASNSSSPGRNEQNGGSRQSKATESISVPNHNSPDVHQTQKKLRTRQSNAQE